jgi:hypothetical protein
MARLMSALSAASTTSVPARNASARVSDKRCLRADMRRA